MRRPGMAKPASIVALIDEDDAAACVMPGPLPTNDAAPCFA